MITTLLPNHYRGIYHEMKGALEEQVFGVDLKRWMRMVLEEGMQVEFDTEVIGVEPFERGLFRKNQRNGFYERSLDTVVGWVEGLKVPRPRAGGWTPKVFEKHGRRQEVLNRLVQECFYRGVSTRDVEKILETLGDIKVSASTVSRLTSQWDEEVKRWHQRRLSDDYRYLFFDGIWIKNRSLGKKRRLILVAYGIQLDGTREIIDYCFAQSEGESNWLRFLTNLQARGLEGRPVELITTDGCRGLANAIDIAFAGINHQLCLAHKMRNVLKCVRVKDQKRVKAGLSPLFKKTLNQKQAMSLIQKWCRRWRKEYPKAVACLERDLDRLLFYLDCDPEHHKAIRTSNHIERQFKEYRRRMRNMELLPNQQSADRVLYALTQIRNEKLREYPMHSHFTQNTLH